MTVISRHLLPFFCSEPTSSSSIAFCHSINLSQKDKCSRFSSSSPWALHFAFLVINHPSSVERDFSQDSWRVFFRAICCKRQSNFLIIIFKNWYKVLVYWRIFNSLIGHKCIHILGSFTLLKGQAIHICHFLMIDNWFFLFDIWDYDKYELKVHIVQVN